MRTAEWSQTSTQRRQLTPCLSTQTFVAEMVATSPGFGCSPAFEAAAPSVDEEKNADNNDRRDKGILLTSRARVPKKLAKEGRANARIPWDAVVLEHV